MKKRNRKGTLRVEHAQKSGRKAALRVDASQWNEYIEM